MTDAEFYTYLQRFALLQDAELIREKEQAYRTLFKIAQSLTYEKFTEIGVRAGYSAFTFFKAKPSCDVVGLGVEGDLDEATQEAWMYAERKFYNRGLVYRVLPLNSHWLTQLPPTDLFYIDGDHSAQGTYSDLMLASRSLNLNGVIILDDWMEGNSVAEGLSNFCNSRSISYWAEVLYIPWDISKPKDYHYVVIR